jgi:hypothetical protein
MGWVGMGGARHDPGQTGGKGWGLDGGMRADRTSISSSLVAISRGVY